MFGRATITLGIGPHSSSISDLHLSLLSHRLFLLIHQFRHPRLFHSWLECSLGMP